MTKTERLRAQLLQQGNWIPFLLQESGLPGRRANIELAQVVADEGKAELFEHLLTYSPESAPVDSPEEFLAFCGVHGLGQLLAQGDQSVIGRLKSWANDPRWRIREAVAMALQRWGQMDMQGLLTEMEKWVEGTWYEQRAAMAALCEPALLRDPETVRRVVNLLEQLMQHIEEGDQSRSNGFLALRKAIGYGWSVAVAANPAIGVPEIERWLRHPNRDIRWIIKENLGKKRLARVDAAWVETCLRTLESRIAA